MYIYICIYIYTCKPQFVDQKKHQVTWTTKLRIRPRTLHRVSPDKTLGFDGPKRAAYGSL